LLVLFQSKNYIDFDQVTVIKNWNDFLTSRFRIIEVFKLGRPLIYGAFKMFAEKRLKTKPYDVFLNSNFKNCPEFVIGIS
jgi:hypothetical protein